MSLEAGIATMLVAPLNRSLRAKMGMQKKKAEREQPSRLQSETTWLWKSLDWRPGNLPNATRYSVAIGMFFLSSWMNLMTSSSPGSTVSWRVPSARKIVTRRLCVCITLSTSLFFSIS